MVSLFATRAGPVSTPLAGRSYWQRHGGAPQPMATAPRSSELPVNVDYAVVGGGLAGLSSALHLAAMAPAATIALLEAQFLGFGASGRNAGLLAPLPAPIWLMTAGHDREHAWAVKHLNTRVHALAGWLQSNAPGAEIAPAVLRIEAQGRLTSAGLASVARTLTVAGIEHTTGTGPSGQLFVDLATHSVQPYRLAAALGEIARGRGVVIHENMPVQAIEETAGGVRLSIAGGRTLIARSVVVCTNAYTSSLALPVQPRAKVVYNFMVASGAIDPARIAPKGDAQRFVVELNTSYVFYRMHENRVIYGGIERFSPCGDSDFAVPPDVLAKLEGLIERSFPGAGITPAEAWGGIYHQTTTDLPLLQRIGAHGSIVLNVGYGGTGVALTQICGRLAASLALGREPVDEDDRRHMEYLRHRGSFADVPADEIRRVFGETYPRYYNLGPDAAKLSFAPA